MSFLPTANQVLAVLCSDIHLSDKAPAFRSLEKDWYGVMACYLKQVDALQQQHNVPVVCAGDIFDRWNSPPRLINFAIAHIKEWYAVPGQHDLEHHGLERIKATAYWTLVEAGVVFNLEPGQPKHIQGVSLWGFPWGVDVVPCSGGSKDPFGLNLAVIHHYLWCKDYGYEGAPQASKLTVWKDKLQGYDACLVGDNHQGFLAKLHYGEKVVYVLNNGTFLKRKADERAYQPKVGLLYGDGRISRVALDCSQDVYCENEKVVVPALDLSEFIQQLTQLETQGCDFPTAVQRVAQQAPKAVKTLLLETLEEVLNA